MAKSTVSNHVMQLEQLIAAPLIAAVDADSLATRRYLEALESIAFEVNKTTGAKTLRTLDFSFQNSDVSGSRERKVSIPLLSLAMLPLLQIEEADFDFDIRILDAVSEEEEKSFSFSGDNAAPAEPTRPAPLALRASLAPKSGSSKEKSGHEQSLAANMRIHVKMRQADLPGGLQNLLHFTAGETRIEDHQEKPV